MMLIMVSMGAKADVKVLFGEKGEDTFKSDRGTIEVKQETSKEDATKVTVYLTVTPNKGYTMLEKDVIEAYATAPANIGKTRAPEVSEKITFDCKDFKDEYSARTYYVDIDPSLALWVKSVTFEPKNRDGAKGDGEPTGPVEITKDTNNNGVIDDGEKKLYLIQTNAFQSFYMVPQGNNITTNNILGNYMLWYFLDAGTETKNNVTTQYYYIVSYTEDKYICHAGGTDSGKRTVTLVEKTSANDERCKFYIELNETHETTGFYNIDAKGKPSYFGLNKQGGSQANTNPIRLTNDDSNHYINDSNSKWNFIRYNGSFTWPATTFTPSTDSDKHFYKILNAKTNDASYYISTDAMPEKVTYASTESDRMVWYLKEVPTDPSEHWFKYYYIINPSTGNKYMYYDGTATDGSNQTNAVSVKEYYNSENEEDRYQFVVVQAAMGDGASRVFDCYAIIPKLLRDKLWTSNSIGLASISDGANMGIISSRGADNTAQWKFVATDFSTVCADPTITFSNTTGKAEISTTTAFSTIHYTTDGSTPSSTEGTEYTGPFDITGETTINAIVTKNGFTDSHVITTTIYQVATPTIQNNEYSISITTGTEGATIYYTTDGNEPTPTTWTEYTGPFSGVSGATIKAIAVKDGMINSVVASKTGTETTLRCATPTFTRSGSSLTIDCDFPSSGFTIYYIKNGGESEPTTTYSDTEPIDVTTGDVIKAIAKANGYNDSYVGVKIIRDPLPQTDGKYLIDSDEKFESFVDMANSEEYDGYHYVLQADVNASVSIIRPFTGTFEVAADAKGNYYKISGLTHALFNTISGGIVKNVVIDDVSISSGTNVGAICNEADGATKIYNCGVLSGSVSGSGCVGGLVGHIRSGSSVRVVNCYNYADVSSSGDYAAGIVGYNEGTVGYVRIALCMMYGSVSGATNISPVYGGNHMNNVQNFTEYNYYLFSNERDANNERIKKIEYTAYNDQLAIDKDDYLTRFPFYRHILNTHRKLGAFFLFGESGETVNNITNDEISEIGHWAIDKSLTNNPYPIVEKWETNTHKILDAPAGTAANVRDGAGGSITSLSVTVKIGTNTYNTYKGVPLTLPITAMDEANHDYTWGKVVLPFANEFEKNTDYTQVCTGWKITGITGGKGGEYSNYNVSDRDCTTKDLFSTTGFVFAQGGNFIVPYNVTGIEITANFAKAYYLSDATYDVGYDAEYKNGTGLGGDVPSGDNSFHGQKVYTSLASALDAMSASATTHAQAIVLVGNFHYRMEKNDLDSYLAKGLTIMSIDEDCNQEPDYGWYSNNYADRPNMPPVRFDFLPMIPLGMAAHVTGSKGNPGIPIWKPRGWFEMTETSLCIMNQFELDSGYFNTSENDKKNYRCIINGGYYVQMIRSNNNICSKVSYFQIGGNAYIKEFYPGNHSRKTHANPLVPINVTGGEIEECFMTGYKSGGTVTGENIYFWCAGGKIHKFLGAYMEAPSASNVNMTAKIDHAWIGRFFGGGTSPNASITGAINVTINNSKVDFYCGGPEFSSTTAKPSVKTTANGTTFGEYYGAGFGGTSVTYYTDIDKADLGIDNAVTSYPNYFTTYYLNATNGRLKHRDDYGIGTCYKFEFLYHSANQCLVARHFTGYAQFSLATTGNVINELTNCKIKKLSASETMTEEATKGDFYGAGCQGMVDGTVTSTLTGCEVDGSAFGGGYQATSNDVVVYTRTKPYPNSEFTKETGLFSEFGKVTPNVFTWVQGTTAKENTAEDCNASGQGGKLYTSKNINMANLGNVAGEISLTIDGGSVTKDVYGGGNESKSLDNTKVTLKGALTVGGDVFGGGNKAVVSGSATVNIVKQ